MKKLKPNNNKIYFTNNERKMHGLPLHRKTNKHKRYKTRCEITESINALLNYWDGIY